MATIRVLIADDSVVYRSQIRAALSESSDIEVVGVASNGRLAIERLLQSPVDLLILDLEMPEMDGIAVLRKLKEQGFECKTLVFASPSESGAEKTMEALSLGAVDFIAKPDGGDETPQQKIQKLLTPRIHALFPNVERTKLQEPKLPDEKKYQPLKWELFHPKILVIGSSTGGPTALEEIFSLLRPPVACPIVIAQHMPPIFTASLADHISQASGIPAREAEDGEALVNNQIYVAPGDFHLRLSGTPQRVIAHLDQGPQINYVRPAVDPLFSSAASIFKQHCLGLVLTGMGSDGKVGAEVIKQNGGAVVIQSEKSCTVFGMPGAVFAAHAYDRIGEPKEIASMLAEKIAPNGRMSRAVGE